MSEVCDVIIIGAGPAGLTAGLYASRAKLNTVILEREVMGGELMNREIIENYPGYPDGIVGPELGSKMLQQTMNYGAKIQLEKVTEVRVEGNYKLIKTAQEEYWGRALVIAGGSHPKKLAVLGEQEFEHSGVFYCATCDGPNFMNKVVAVAGGGDSGIAEALILCKMVAKVIVLEIMPQCTATKVLLDRAETDPKIEIRRGVRIEAIRGDKAVKAIDIVDVQNGEKGSLEVDGVLIHVGIEPNTDYLKGIIPLNDKGQVIVNERMETEIPGVFAAGDIRRRSPCQICTAVGDGATAALSLQYYLQTAGAK